MTLVREARIDVQPAEGRGIRVVAEALCAQLLNKYRVAGVPEEVVGAGVTTEYLEDHVRIRGYRSVERAIQNEDPDEPPAHEVEAVLHDGQVWERWESRDKVVGDDRRLVVARLVRHLRQDLRRQQVRGNWIHVWREDDAYATMGTSVATRVGIDYPLPIILHWEASGDLGPMQRWEHALEAIWPCKGYRWRDWLIA